MISIYIDHNGCEPTEFDAICLKEKLRSQFNVEFSCTCKSDIVVFLGCTFTEQKEIELLEKINLFVDNPEIVLVVVSGCYLTIQSHPKIRYARLTDVPKVISEYFQQNNIKYGRAFGDVNHGIQPSLSQIISISDGCYGNCSYCSIKTVRGEHRSRPMTDVLADIERVSSKNEKIKLTSVDTAGYGIDNGLTLPQLLKQIFLTFPHLSVELGSLNPKLMSRFTDSELAVFADEHICSNLHLPLQSASNRVLQAMRRGYTLEEYEKIKSRLMNVGVKLFSTDLIAGFPEETDNDHAASLSFLNDHELEFVQIFFFEPRPSTDAMHMPMLDRDIRIARGIDLIARFLISYLRFKGVNPEMLINGDIILPFNSNLNIKIEELGYEC